VSEDLRGQALRLLARREHTRAELLRRLTDSDNAEEVVALLDGLEASGLLSDARFAESYLASKASRMGSSRLRHELRTRGVPERVIDEALANPAQDELARAREVWRRKFGTLPADAREYAKQLRFLQSRGFSTDTFKCLLKHQEEEQ
jgi:regulatory protein